MRFPGSGKPLQPNSALSDGQLLVKYRLEQDPEVIGELFTRYTHLVYGSCIKYLGDQEMARDAVMQIFEGLFDSLLKTEVRHFSSWLYQVSRNHCLMEIRRRQSGNKALEVLKEEFTNDLMESEDSMHLNTTEDDMGYPELRRALGKIREEQRVCIELMYLEGRSYKDIAEITGYEVSKVKSHIQNGKRKLRILLERSLLIFILLFIR